MRQPFAYSLDRELIVDTIGQGVIPFEGNGGVSQTTPGYSQDAADTYSLDLATRRPSFSTTPAGTRSTTRASARGTASA